MNYYLKYYCHRSMSHVGKNLRGKGAFRWAACASNVAIQVSVLSELHVPEFIDVRLIVALRSRRAAKGTTAVNLNVQ